tara:strand:+ start:919 stop:1053 length:135 start_codon:yes stop_codon:yes gene_type:complete
MNDDTTDYSGQQNVGSEKGLTFVIWILILFILLNEVSIEWGYRR